jgi:hypothetical protein
LIREASTRSTLTTTTTTTTTTNPMIMPTHQPPRCGSPSSFNVTSNPARNVLALDQVRNAAVSLFGSQSEVYTRSRAEGSGSIRSVAPRGIRSLSHPKGLRRLLNVDHGVVLVLVMGRGSQGMWGVGVELVSAAGGVLR